MIWATIFTETIFTEEMGEGFYHLCLLQLRLRTSKILKHHDSKYMYFNAKTLSVCLNTVLDQDLSTLLCTQFSSAKEPDKPLHLLSTLIKSLFIMSVQTGLLLSLLLSNTDLLGQNSSSLLSKIVFVLSVCTRLVNAVLANTHIFLLPPCLVFKPL